MPGYEAGHWGNRQIEQKHFSEMRMAHETILVGSSLDVHDVNSFRLGAAKA